MAYDTASAKCLCTVQGMDKQAQVSPDGCHLAVSANAMQPTSHIRSLYNSQPDLQQSLSEHSAHFAWHPANSSLLAMTILKPGSIPVLFMFHTAVPDLLDRWRLEAMPSSPMVWSPNGQYISVHTQMPGRQYASIFETHDWAAGGETASRASAAPLHVAATPCAAVDFSPDSSRYMVHGLCCQIICLCSTIGSAWWVAIRLIPCNA